ncbi:BRCT domain-containing protein [Platanthera guangdongensis]|uniref:BRCT domain-containing protein n=1 Tax=Platanthera guangdongensis TaxID=2320717 RepID=A0ABR2MAI3_9ASPA
MDSEEEANDTVRNNKEQMNIGEPHCSRGEMSIIMNSGALDAKNFNLQKDILAAKIDSRVNNQLGSTPHKVNGLEKSPDICDMKSKVLVFGYPEGRSAEQFSENHGLDIMTKQPNTTDSRSPSYRSNSLMGMTSCKEDMQLSSLSYSRKAIEKVVSLEENSDNLCALHEGKPEEENLKRVANNSFSESKRSDAKNCIEDNLHSPMMGLATPNVEGQIHTYPQKRKLSVSKIGSKSMKSDHISRTSGSLNGPMTIISADLDSLKLQQQEPENIPTRSEIGESINHIVDNNDASSLMQKFSALGECSPNLAHDDSTTCIQSLSTSMMPRQSESLSALQYGLDHSLTHSGDFEGTALIQSSGKKHVPFSKSSSLGYKRKSLKHKLSASVANISGNSSSTYDNDNKDEPLGVGTVCGAGTLSGVASPKAVVLSDCPQKNVIGPGMDRSPENAPNLCRLPLAGDGKNENEVSIGVRVLQASLKSTRKSETSVKSQNFDGISIKDKPDIHAEVPKKHEKPDKIEEVIPYALIDPNVKSSVSTPILGSVKENEGSFHCNHKVVVSRNTGCRSKTRRGNGCKRKNSNDSLRRINQKKNAIESGNDIVESGNEVKLKEKVGKEDPPMEEKTRVEQHFPSEHNFQIKQNEKRLDPEKENKDGCNFSVKQEENCGNKMKNKRKSFLIAKSSSKDNISSLPKQNCPSAMPPEPIWFILAGKYAQRKEFHIIISRLRGRICKSSHNWSYKATHFIVPDSVRRTEKFFAAAAAGRWILRSDYLTASSKAGKFLDEEPFEWHRNGLTEDGLISFEAPRKWRTLKQMTGYGAFYGMRIIIYGECIAPSLDTLKRVVKAGDGIILATSPPYTRYLKLESSVDFAIVSASIPHTDIWIQEFLRCEIPCILADYLVEYVCKPGYSLVRHVLYNTHVWAEKSLANLLTRSSEERVFNEGSNEGNSDDLICSGCGSRDRAEVMLICGDEAGTLGCGVRAHINCCDPPLAAVPGDDWFCSGCSSSRQKTSDKSTKVRPKKEK